jgi:lysophospholipid acyltransferase (LPLAT)-like uncharacterized protein
MKNGTNSIRFQDRISGIGLYWLSQLVRKTCEFQINNPELMLTVMGSEHPVIITGWHGITMMAVPLIQRLHPTMSDFVVLMPDDWRGTTLKIWTDKLGATPHPMNLAGDDTLGMARQVVRLTRRVIAGKNLYINPDGPDGPAHRIKPGITFIARKANAIIVPVGAYCRHAYNLGRWDRYTVPYPFSRICYHIGQPIESLSEDDAAAEQLITNTLNRVTLQAAADYYEQHNVEG